MSRIRLSESSTPSTPATNKLLVFADSADAHLKQIDDAGTVIDLTAGSSDALLNNTGRAGGTTLIGGTSSGDDLTFQTTSNVLKGSYIFSELNTANGLVQTDGSGVLSTTLTPSGLTSVSATTLTDGTLSITGGTISSAVSGTFSSTVQGATINGTSAIQLNGTSINTGATLSNVAYLDQTNIFTGGNQEIQGGQLLVDYSGAGSAIAWANSTFNNNSSNFKLAINAGTGFDSQINFTEGGSNRWQIYNDGNGGSDSYTLRSASGGNVYTVAYATSIMTMVNDLNLSSGKVLTYNGTDINTGGTLSNVAYLDQSNNFTNDMTITSATSNKPVVTIANTNADAIGARLEMFKNSASPADDDELADIRFVGDDSGGAPTDFATIRAFASDVTDTDEAGEITLSVLMDGTSRSMLNLNGYNGSVNQGEIIINEDGQDVDFRVEASGVASALTVQGSDGLVTAGATFNAVTAIQLNGTDINTGATLSNVAYLDQANTFTASQTIQSAGAKAIFLYSSDTNDTTIWFGHDLGGTPDYAGIQFDQSLDILRLFNADSAANDHLIISNAGKIGINTSSPDTQLQVVGDTKFGDDNTNYASFSATGDLSFTGSANYIVANNSYAFVAAADNDAGLFFNSTSNRYEFRDASAASMMNVSIANGNVGIGTTSPLSSFDISRSATFANQHLATYSASLSHYPIMTFLKSYSNTIGTLAETQTNDFLGVLVFKGVNSSSASVNAAAIYARQNGAAGASYVPANLVFQTSNGTTANAERMRIDSSGNVGIGLAPTANMAGLSIEAGVITIKETTTPTADTNYGKVYTKTDNKLYFQSGDGVEHELGAANNANLSTVISRSKITYSDTDTVTIGAGKYRHNGTSDQVVSWTSALTFDFGSAGSNAGSTNLGANQSHYLYIDDSAVVTLGSSTLTASEFLNSTTAPTWNATKQGWYNGNDLCIFGFRTNASSQIRTFYHQNDSIQYEEQISDLALTDIDTTYTDVTLTIPNFGDDAIAYITFHGRYLTSGGNQAYVRKNGSTATTQLQGYVDASTEKFMNFMQINVDATQKIEVAMQSAGGSQVAVFTNGFRLPIGM